MAFNTENHPGVSPTVPKATQGFVLNHSMLRVKDPARLLSVFTPGCWVCGVLRKLDFAEMKFSLYFLARVTETDEIPEDEGTRTAWTFSQTGILELTPQRGQ